MKRIPAAAMVAVALLFLAPALGLAQTRGSQATGANQSPLQSLQSSFQSVAKKILPVVVEINVTETVTQTVPQFDFPFPFGQQSPNNGRGQQRTFQQSALGSGIIVQRSGNRYYVLTNNHVVDNATEVTVRLYDQKTFKATVVGKDSLKDLAMVSFESTAALPVAELGDSSGLEVGDIVLAVGNPFGFESSMTMGIVSALGRRGPQSQASSYTDYIQTDAAINQGNSGGALVNVDGQVVGINTWIAAPTGGNVGLGFAIPINNTKSAVNDFITKGKVQYGWLGVQITDIQDASTYPNFARDLKVEGVKGALVLNVYKGSPAAAAGMLPGDYVTRVDATDIQSSDNLTQVVGGLLAGKSYQFALLRGGEKVNLTVKITVRDEQGVVAQYKNLWPGMTVVSLSDEVRQQANIPQGLSGVVVGYLPDQSTPAAVAGFQVGDLITGINGKAVRSILDFYKAMNDLSKRTVTFTVNRQGTDVTVGLTR